ncbi:helix-turn-helix domain-containing protein [Streptomyces sp. NPDC001828]|uniref:helix-turn-helix domain-containing protein n=1 Tax=Streptomyces sp. NPDC001828 TaxID=3364615 RepID=UPI003685C5AF
MGRPELPVALTTVPLTALGKWLRHYRAQAGIGYREMSARTGFSPATLQRAADGKKVPKLPVVLAYAEACSASTDVAEQMWKQARYTETRSLRTKGGVPRPRMIRDIADLGVALVDLYRRAGSPSTHKMQEKAGEYGVLPRSSAHRIVTRQTVPHSEAQLQGFLRACDVPEAEWTQWKQAWSRARQRDRQTDLARVERNSWRRMEQASPRSEYMPPHGLTIRQADDLRRRVGQIDIASEARRKRQSRVPRAAPQQLELDSSLWDQLRIELLGTLAG